MILVHLNYYNTHHHKVSIDRIWTLNMTLEDMRAESWPHSDNYAHLGRSYKLLLEFD